MNAILWPEDYIPGFTDNFVSNEVIVAGLSAADIWPFLSNAPLWPGYYSNSANIRFHDGKGPELAEGARFYFETFGFPVEAQCTEHVPPAEGRPGRVAWHGWAGEEGADNRLDVHHAWLVEDLSGSRVRILTQETQKGKPAQDLAKAKPNPMINGHQDWLDGLVAAARAAKEGAMTGAPMILMVLTSHASIGDTGKPTGVWFEELTTPYYQFADAGAEVDIVSIDGGKVPIDPASVKVEGENPASVDRFLKDEAAMAKIGASRKIADVSVEPYDAIFLPGGHGTMWDLPNSDALGALLSKAWAEGKVLAAVCHGPAGLVNVRDAEGKPVIAGRRVAGFSNSEEKAAGLDQAVPFLLETRLRERDARYENGPDFQPFALRDGRLITGQNPASSEDAARLTLEAIKSAD